MLLTLSQAQPFTIFTWVWLVTSIIFVILGIRYASESLAAASAGACAQDFNLEMLVCFYLRENPVAPT